MTVDSGVLSKNPDEYAEFLRKKQKDYSDYVTAPGAAGDVQIAGRTYNQAEAYNLANTQDSQIYNEILTTLRAVNLISLESKPKRPSVITTWQKFLDNFYNQASPTPKDWVNYVNDEAQMQASQQGIDTGTSTFLQPRFTTPEDARQDLATTYREYLGVDPETAQFKKEFNKDFKEYYRELRKLEKAQPTRQVTTRDGSGTTVQTIVKGFSDEDLEELKLKYITKYVDAKGVENVGGAIASNLRAIRKFTSDYGVVIPDADIRTFALNSIRDKTGLDNAENRIVNIAKAAYPALIPYIDQGLSVRDIASQYIAKKASVLELSPDAVSLNDEDIKSVLQGEKLQPLFDFERNLRKNPLWQYTNNAREEASGFAGMVLKDFGLI